MKKQLVIYLSLFLAFPIFGQDYVENELIVRLNDESRIDLTYDSKAFNPDLLKAYPFITKNKIEKIEGLYSRPKGHIHKAYIVTFDPSFGIENIITNLNKEPLIKYAHKNTIYYSNSQEGVFTEQWSLEKIMNGCDLSNFPAINPDVKIKIAIIDDAFDIYHEDLANNIWTNPIEVENEQDTDLNEYIDDLNGWDIADNDNNVFKASLIHGTHCAGIAAAVTNNNIGIASVSYNRAEIIPLKVQRSGSPVGFLESDIVKALEYAIDAGADVISMSFGSYALETETETELETKILAAAAVDIVMVAAAGNDGMNTQRFPASFPDVISVGATGENDEKAVFSNFHEDVDVMAPGVGIYSTFPENNYIHLDGTSMSTPMVAGICAALLSANDFTPEEVKTKLMQGCDPIHQLPGNNGFEWQNYMGAGRVNFCEIMSSAYPTPIANFENSHDFICPGMDVTFTEASYGATANNLVWNVLPPATIVSNNGNNITVHFPTIGDYNIELLASNNASVTPSSISKTISVQNVGLTIVGDNFSTLCKGNNGYCYLELTGNPPFTIKYSDNTNNTQYLTSNENTCVLAVNTDNIGTHTYHISKVEDANCEISLNETIEYTVTDCGDCESKTDNKWYFGHGAAVDFNQSPPSAIVNSSMDTECGSSSISNPNGELLFYTNGYQVWKANGQLLAKNSGAPLFLNGQGTDVPSLIVPNPLNEHQFYIFTSGSSFPSGSEMQYTVVEVDNLNDPNSLHVFNNFSHVPVGGINNSLRSGMTLIHGPDVMWVITHEISTNKWYKIPVTGQYTGITAISQSIGANFTLSKAILKSSKSGTKIVAAPTSNTIEIYKFSPTTGNIGIMANEFISGYVTPNFNFGFEFSPDESKLYYSIFEYNYIAQLDLNASDIAASVHQLEIPIGTKVGALQQASDKCIYYARKGDNYLGVIPNSNKDNPIAINNGVYLNEKSCGSGLQNYRDLTQINTVMSSTELLCFGDDNATASVGVTGGKSPYTYQWDNNASSTNQTITHLPAGTYKVTVMDANHCMAIDEVTIENPEELVIGSINTIHNCFGEYNIGEISVNANGGTGAYNYSWSASGAGPTSSYINAYHISGLSSGIHYLTVTDANHCITTEEISINSSSEIFIDDEIIECHADGGIINITPSGGTPDYSYTWTGINNFNSTNQNINNLLFGHYRLTVTDANNCKANAKYYLIERPLAADINLTHLPCPTNAISDFKPVLGTAEVVNIANGTPAYTYTWSTGSNNSNVNGLNVGIYSVYIEDVNGCYLTINDIEITQPDDVTYNFPHHDVDCYGNNNGDYSILINNTNITGGTPFPIGTYYMVQNHLGNSVPYPGQAYGNLSEGTYTGLIIDRNMCKYEYEVEITEPAKLKANVNCALTGKGQTNMALTSNPLGGSGGYSYQWYWSYGLYGPFGESTAYSITINNYVSAMNANVTVTDANDCTSYWSGIPAGLNCAVGPFRDVEIKNESIMNSTEISIFPNPAKDILNIKCSNTDVKVKSIVILNELSQTIVSLENTTENIDISELKSGIYIVKIETSEGLTVKQFVKQ